MEKYAICEVENGKLNRIRTSSGSKQSNDDVIQDFIQAENRQSGIYRIALVIMDKKDKIKKITDITNQFINNP